MEVSRFTLAEARVKVGRQEYLRTRLIRRSVGDQLKTRRLPVNTRQRPVTSWVNIERLQQGDIWLKTAHHPRQNLPPVPASPNAGRRSAHL